MHLSPQSLDFHSCVTYKWEANYAPKPYGNVWVDRQDDGCKWGGGDEEDDDDKNYIFSTKSSG